MWPLLAFMVGSSVVQAIGQKKQGNSANEAAKFNAKVAEQQAEDAVLRGHDEETRFRQGVRMLVGSQRADFAGQGVDVSQGSAADVQADAAFLGELDAQKIRTNAALEAWGYRQQAESFRRGGQAASSAANWNVASTALGGATSVVAAAYGWGRTGRATAG